MNKGRRESPTDNKKTKQKKKPQIRRKKQLRQLNIKHNTQTLKGKNKK